MMVIGARRLRTVSCVHELGGACAKAGVGVTGRVGASRLKVARAKPFLICSTLFSRITSASPFLLYVAPAGSGINGRHRATRRY